VTAVLLDTNVLVSFLTDRNPGQQRLAAALFAASAEMGRPGLLLPQVVVFELAYVLSNLFGRGEAEVRAVVEDLLALPHLAVIDELSWTRVLEYWPDKIAGLADAALAALGREHGIAVATFDRKLAKRLRSLGIATHDW
jgi:predicted nucleic acid-binding protein